MAGNTYVNNTGRQEVISAVQILDFVEIAVAGNYAAFDIPPKAVLLSGSVKVLEVFDTGRTAAIVLDGDTLIAAAALDAVATTALTIPTKQYSAQVQGVITTSGAMTQGKALIEIQYVLEGRSAFSHG